MGTTGIHHVTAIAGNARRNLDFYTRTLGLRLVKRTVNFDDPGTYHFYFGDAQRKPGHHHHVLPLVPRRLRPARHGRDPGNRIARSGSSTRLLAGALRGHGREP